ncbi:hypothetical protein [Aneurinibacillus aneurinilyticus]|uniref:hypothetical protein n=1 Tax=Aneurinibacillus aneurinilyticus TaxID=1391 RepID=UPI00366F00E0
MAFIEIPTFLTTQLKLIGATGALAVGTVVTHRKLTQSTAHGRLRSVCEACKLYTEKTNLLGKKYRVYPQVKSVTYGIDGITLVFSIPFGLNPESIEKATWAFRQQFGEDTELSRAGQRFTLTAVKRGVPNEVPYNMQEISTVTQDMRLPIVVGRSDSVIEPKLGDKGTPEPDTFTIWKGTPFFIEIQRSQYSERIMSEKITRYERYYYEEEWRYASWQPKDRPPVFPYIWIISEVNYRLASSCLRFVQSKSVAELIERTETPQYTAVH